jgi:hypothetical protein
MALVYAVKLGTIAPKQIGRQFVEEKTAEIVSK